MIFMIETAVGMAIPLTRINISNRCYKMNMDSLSARMKGSQNQRSGRGRQAGLSSPDIIPAGVLFGDELKSDSTTPSELTTPGWTQPVKQHQEFRIRRTCVLFSDATNTTLASHQNLPLSWLVRRRGSKMLITVSVLMFLCVLPGLLPS